MRPRIVIAVLLLGAFLLGVVFVSRPGGPRREDVAAALPKPKGNAGQAEVQRPEPRPSEAAAAGGATSLDAGPRPAEAEASAQARQTAYVESRAAELMKLASQGDAASIEIILSELTNRDPRIRQAALEAVLQVRSREAIPRLMEAAEQTDDPREKVAIADAVEFLKLPTLGEVLGRMGEQATNAPAAARGAELR